MSAPAAVGADLALGRLRRMAGERFGAPGANAVLLAGDASERRYARLHHPGAEPRSSIGMILSAPFDPKELPFLEVRAHLAAIGQPVPEVYAMDPEAGLILLEDGGGCSLEDLWNASRWEAARPYYEKAVDHLISLQEAKRAGCECFTIAGWSVGRFGHGGLTLTNERPRWPPDG